MNKLKTTLKRLWNDESAQGATEYILILVVVVGLVVAFKDPLTEAVNGQIDNLSNKLGQFE